MKIFSPLKVGPILSVCVDVGRSSMVGPKAAVVQYDCQISAWLNSAVYVDVGRSSVVGPKAPHEVSPYCIKGVWFGNH